MQKHWKLIFILVFISVKTALCTYDVMSNASASQQVTLKK